ncbi:arsenate reductase/protein-tyrosine-phosphatase family protein [Arthrobacter sp. AOP36-A1-22]|uniref:arsenate reductase/protein-tyrosine-phosphatase family protein n=1 Tax=unclassified Arthrobacter TaxID=235627 RepID=UPI004034847E
MVKILAVCTGNICRSPFVERYLQRELEQLAPGAFQITSAGTGALVGQPMDQRAAESLKRAGGSAGGFLARQLTEAHLKDADFVLALTEGHRSAVVSMSPRMLKRAYTVREFARVLEVIAAAGSDLHRGGGLEEVRARWNELPKVAARHRYEARELVPGGNDVIDPYRESTAVYQQMTDELLPALQGIVDFEAAMIA